MNAQLIPTRHGPENPSCAHAGNADFAHAGTVPSDVTFGVKPYPWPAVLVNFAVFISGGFFKLLMVLAFLPQVRCAAIAALCARPAAWRT